MNASHYKHPEHYIYTAWVNMCHRCHNPKNSDYNNYGGRGIKVCNLWRRSFIKFFIWYKDNKGGKGLVIDRKNNNKGYSPSNCRIVTQRINCRNKRNNRFININGEIRALKEWCEIYNISYLLVHCRLLRYKWDIITALTTPIRKKQKLFD